MLIHAGLPQSLLPEAIAAACYITNRLRTKALDGKTPYKAWYKCKGVNLVACTNTSKVDLVGCPAWIKEAYSCAGWSSEKS